MRIDDGGGFWFCEIMDCPDVMWLLTDYVTTGVAWSWRSENFDAMNHHFSVLIVWVF